MRELRERVITHSLEERPERTVRERVREAASADQPSPEEKSAAKRPVAKRRKTAAGVATQTSESTSAQENRLEGKERQSEDRLERMADAPLGAPLPASPRMARTFQNTTTAQTAKPAADTVAQAAFYSRPRIQASQGAAGAAAAAAGTSSQSVNGRQLHEKSGRSVKLMGKALKLGGRGLKTAARAGLREGKETATQGDNGQTPEQQVIGKAGKQVKRVAQATGSVVAKQTAKITVRAARVLVKLAAKAVVAAFNALVALVGSTGGAVLIVILLVVMVAAVVASPLAVFFGGSVDGNSSLTEVVQTVEGEYTGRISQIVEDADADEVEYNYTGSADNDRVDNWRDVVAVWSVVTAMDATNPDDVVTMDETRQNRLREIFWNMNTIQSKVEVTETETEPAGSEDTPEPSATPSTTPAATAPPAPPHQTPIMNARAAVAASPSPTGTFAQPKRKLILTLTSRSWDDVEDDYHLNDEQQAMLQELMSKAYFKEFATLLGIDPTTGLSPSDLVDLINNLPYDDIGAEIVKVGLTRLGDPYSQPKAGQGDYVDCSYFARWCYRQVGIDVLPRTAAAQAKYCYENDLTIAKEDLKPGDLIFFDGNKSRWMEIGHVAIYAGDGMIVDASSSRGQVVYRKLWSSGQVMYARPYAKR